MSGIDEMILGREIMCSHNSRKPNYWVAKLTNGQEVFLLTSEFQIKDRRTHTILYSGMEDELQATDLDYVRYISCSVGCKGYLQCKLTSVTDSQLFKRVIQTMRHYLLKEGHGVLMRWT